jgi:glycosyltransferase involved in cell wall biosynthesis
VSADNSPKISVAIITYNQRVYLQQAIESALAQNYPNLEIVVADDGSTDGTQDLLHSYSQSHPGKFKLELAGINCGITANCNRAIFACTGKYIAWLGGDDLMLPGRLQQQIEYMESHPECAACFHDLDVFESSTGKSIGRFSDTYPVDKFHANALQTILRYGMGGGPSAMVRASMYPVAGFD